MKILRALFQNYAGLVEGIGQEVVELDFTSSNEAEINKIMLLGRNGSGKSVTANALSPFAENFDNRDSVIIPGRNGRKEIVYETKDGTIVKCVHLWTKKGKVKSFLYLNDEEEPVDETVKGNVTNFKNAVRDYLGVDTDFMKIGKIGADINNFIDLKPTERKSFLSKFMPEVEEWAKMNKNAGQRLTDIRREIKGLQVELDKLESIEELVKRITKLNFTIENLQEESNKLHFNKGQETTKLETFKNKIDSVISDIKSHIIEADIGISSEEDFTDIITEDKDPVRSLEDFCKDHLAKLEEDINALIEKLPVLSKYVDGTSSDTLQERIQKFNNELSKAESSLEFLEQKLVTSKANSEKINSELTDVKNELSKISKSKSTLDKLEKELETASKELDEFKEKYKDIPIDTIDDSITFEEVKETSDQIRNLCDNIDSMLNHFESDKILTDCIAVNFEPTEISNLVKYNRNKSKELTEDISKKHSRKKIAEAQAQYARRMSVHKCKNHDCPHEKNIKEFLKAEDQLNSFDSDVEKLKSRAEYYEALEESYSNALTGCGEVKETFNNFRKHAALLKKINAWEYFVNFSNFIDLIRLPVKDIKDILSVDYYFEALSAKRDITNAEKQVNDLQDKISNQNNSKEYYDFFTTKKDQLEKDKASNQELISDLNTKISDTKKNIDKLKFVITKCTSLANMLDMESKFTRIITNINATIEQNKQTVQEVDEIYVKLEEITERYNTLQEELTKYDEDVNKLNIKKGRREEFEERLDILQDTLDKTQLVYNATHPSKGAPVNFIKAFLESIRDIVNDLLDDALDGDMRIDFDLNEKEFRIPVTKASGADIPDVLQCSLGQVSLVKTVLSLALVKNLYINSNTAYNIITLDEIDGPLDHEKNRKRFTLIIDKLCNELGIEQVFIISHNDNFFANELGLVLFPGHCMPIDDETFMSNKIIVADYS